MDASDFTTQPYPVIKPRFTLPTLPSRRIVRPVTQPMQALPQSARKQGRLRVVLIELFYAVTALSLGVVAYHSLAVWPVYRVMSCAIIVILWSNIAGREAQRKPIEERETKILQAISPALTQDTMTYLKTVKASMKHRR